MPLHLVSHRRPPGPLAPRLLLSGLLGLVALQGCASTPAARPEPSAPAAATPTLKDCDTRPTDEGIAFECERVTGSILGSNVSVEQALRAYVEDLKGTYADQGQVESTLVDEGAARVPGRTAMKLRIQWKRPEQPLAEGYVFGFERRGGGSRVASCIAADGGQAPWELCSALLRTTPELPDPTALLGKPVPVPEGCEPQHIRSGAYGVACEGASLMWIRVNGPVDPATPQKLTRSILRSAKKVMENTPVACKVRGHAATCHRVAVEAEQGLQSALISAVGEAQHMMVVTCSWTTGGPLPAMCSDIFTVE